jgi:hypothetical protein
MKADKIAVTIRIKKTEANRLGEIVDALKSGGLERVESHERFMIVNGDIDLDAIEALQSIKGVASVRQDGVYKAK